MVLKDCYDCRHCKWKVVDAAGNEEFRCDIDNGVLPQVICDSFSYLGGLDEIADFYGLRHQLNMAQEECAELIQAISKYRRNGDVENLHEEIADVEIMLTQLKYLLKCWDEVDEWREMKMKRTFQRMEEE